MPKNVFPLIRYTIGNIYRSISSPWAQYQFNVSDISNLFGCNFGLNGWHPIKETIKEFDLNNSINPQDTTLWKYHKNFEPKSISYFIDFDIDCDLPTFVYPWGTFNSGEITSKKIISESRFCGPSTDKFIYEEYNQIIKLYKKLKLEGYRPKEFPNSYIGGTIMKAESGDMRFIVMQGNHRLSILSYLGIEKIDVRLISNAIHFVNESEISSWPLVKNKTCSVKDARKIFNFFFYEKGDYIKTKVQNYSKR